VYLPQHVGTNDIHLLIEFIAKRVNPGEVMQHFCEDCVAIESSR
jgi:hypothetical protein